MRKWIYLMLLLGWALGACTSSPSSSPQSQPAAPGGVVIPERATPTSPPVVTKTASPSLEPSPVHTSTSVSQPLEVSSSAMPGCTARSLFPTPDPTLEALFPAVSDADWKRGPETASVTLIEYSDFQ